MSSDIWRSDVYPFAVSNATLGFVICHLSICHQNSWQPWKDSNTAYLNYLNDFCRKDLRVNSANLDEHSTASSFAKDKEMAEALVTSLAA